MELHTIQRNYTGEWPATKSPNVVGFFSVDAKGTPYVSTEHLGYLRWQRFYRKKIKLDLTKGENESERRTENHDFTFYRHLSFHPSIVEKFSSQIFDDVGFICNRQVLRKLANLPYQDRDPELYSACLFQGNIYLAFLKGEEMSNERMQRCSRWGYKFEQHLLSKTPDSEPDIISQVIEGEEFGCIFENKLGNHRLLYAAEMDGIIFECGDELSPVSDISESSEEKIIDELNQKNFVELKTSAYDDGHRNFRRFKSREIWTQSYFSGLKAIVIGIRNFDGVVSDLRRYDISDMINIGEGYWSPDVCLNFLDSFLSFVKNCIAKEFLKVPDWSPDTNIKDIPMIEIFFERKLRSPVVVSKKERDDIRPYKFSWFIDGITAKSNSQ